MQFPRIYIDEPLPTGYSGSVKVLVNLTTKELNAWFAANLGTPGCAACKEEQDAAPPEATLRERAPVFCPACTTARQSFGELIGLIYGPKLFDEDVSTPDRALAFFDNDEALPSELVAWLFVLPDSLRLRRTETIRKNARSSSGLTDNS